MPTATATGGGGADAAPLRCASSLRMARRLLSTAYRSACSRSRSSRLPARERGVPGCSGARERGAGGQRCRGAEGGGAARRAVLRGGGERRLGEHALQLLLLLLRRLQAARRHERSLQLRLLLHLGARGTRQPVAIRPRSRGRRIGPVAAGHRGERRVQAAAARLCRRLRTLRRWRRWRPWCRRRGRHAVGDLRDRHLDQEYAPLEHARRDDRLEAGALRRRELDLHAGPHAWRHLDAYSLHSWRRRRRSCWRRPLAV